MASKKRVTAKKEVRQVEETKKANLEKALASKVKTETIVSQLKASEGYNAGVSRPETNNLLGF